MTLLEDVRTTLNYVQGLGAFWRTPYDSRDPVGAIRQALVQRNAAFLTMLRQCVFSHPASPYCRMMQGAGIDAERAGRLVRDHGVEGALRRLYEAGVHVTLDEFKGRVSLRRGGREIPITATTFDNPGGRPDIVGTSGGTRSRGSRVILDLRDLLSELPARQLFLMAHGLMDLPYVIWRPAPPAMGAIRNLLRTAKLGIRLERWYSQTKPGLASTGGRSAVLTWCTTVGSALLGHRFPRPEYVPASQAERIARWLAAQTARGRHIHLDVIVSSGVRICLAARRLGLDISGHTFRTNSEPLTDAKAAIMRACGLYVCSMYGTAEAGIVAVSCAEPAAVDDMHLLTYRSAILQIPRTLPGWPEPIDAIFLTLFAPHVSKVMINVEMGDYGTAVQRECGCLLGRAGLDWHLHTIRSYEKLTSEGMHFMGADLMDLLDVALPRRFGGGPTDYQFVEDEVDGQTVLNLVVAPAVGPLDDQQVIDYVLADLRQRTRAGRLMTDIWRDSRLLRVVRAEPYVTGGGKIQTLHVVKKR